MGWLDGYVAIVTGGGSGIGAAVVRRYLEEGAAGVVALDRKIDALDATELKFPGRVVGIVGDVRDHKAHAETVTAAVKTFGRLDVVVGNAGIFDFHRPLESYSPETLSETFDEIFAVNAKGYLFAAMASREHLVASRGSLIFTASVASLHPGGGGIVYTMSKHAIVGLVRRLAFEFAPDVRVNGVGPGGTLTNLSGSQALGHANRSLADKRAAMEQRMTEGVPLRFAQEPEDHTGLYVLLASRNNARAITGEVYMSDGGIGIRPL